MWDLHYPTFVLGKSDDKYADKLQTWEGFPTDPWTNDYHENDVVSGVDQDDE